VLLQSIPMEDRSPTGARHNKPVGGFGCEKSLNHPVTRTSPVSGETSEKGRRRSERIPASGPAAISHEGGSLAATLRDVSIGGLFLFTDAPFRAGAEIQVVLMLPPKFGLESSQTVCCHGKIVRVEEHAGQYGIAAQIERIEGLPQGWGCIPVIPSNG